MGFSVFCAVASLFFVLSIAHAAPTLDQSTWVTNGNVQASVINGTDVYIGGSFTYVGPYTGNGVPVSSVDGSAVSSYAKVDGSISAVLSDGSGGWFIAGDFTKVGSLTRNRLAHIKSDGSVDTGWNPNADAQVFAMAFSPDHSIIYVGGNFTAIGSQTRQYLATVSAASGAVTSWVSNANGAVSTIAPTGTLVYIGGSFTSAGGNARNFIAAIDASTGNATTWDPSSNSSVNSIQLSAGGETIYAAGSFTNIGSESRGYVAALDATTATATAWNPGADNTVQSIYRSGSTIYAGGYFTNIGGASRYYVAAIDASTGSATAWNPSADGMVSAISSFGGTIYLGGGFTNIGGQWRNYIAAVNNSTGSATSWNPNASSNINALAVNETGSKIYLGGDFNSINGALRNYIAQIDLDTGAATAWNPNADGVVSAMAFDASNSKLYVGGAFLNIGGQARSRIAALKLSDGSATSWNPGAGNTVNVLRLSSNKLTVYAGGSFTTLGGESRSYLGAIGASTAEATPWVPSAIYPVYDIAINQAQNLVFAGSGLVSCGPGPILITSFSPSPTRLPLPPWPPICRYYGRVDAYQVGSGDNLWGVRANERVFTVALSNDDSTLYAGGNFYTFDAETRNRIAALTSIDTASPVLSSWNPDANANVSVIRVSPGDSLIYAGGGFTSMGGTTRNYTAAINASGALDSWNPSADNSVLSIAFDPIGSKLVIGGDFLSLGTVARPGLAEYTFPASQTSQSSGGEGTPLYALNRPQVEGLGVKINNDATETVTGGVTLTITTNSSVDRMAVSNYADFHDAGIETISQNKDWDLCKLDTADLANGCPSGLRTVYVKFYTSYGQPSDVASDSITYNKSGTASADNNILTGQYLIFSYDRAIGARNPDIKLLQHFLNVNGFSINANGPGSLGNETTFFGRATFNALSKFQKAYAGNMGITLSNPGIGRLGPMTRKFINSQQISMEASATCSPPSSWCW